MYLLYVDESGDTGRKPGSSEHFALSGLVIRDCDWQATLDKAVEFRRGLKSRYGLRMRDHIHAVRMLADYGGAAHISKDIRLRILRESLDFLAGLPQTLSVLNVYVTKVGKRPDYDPFEMAWTMLLQRFADTIRHTNFPGGGAKDESGLLIADGIDDRRLRALTRQRRRYNPLPDRGGGGSRLDNLTMMVEDPCHRRSAHSYFLQLTDVAVYFLHQKHKPNKYVRKKGARNWFNRLDPVLCKHASKADPQGIVRH